MRDVSYHVYHYDSESDDVANFEELMTTIFAREDHVLIDLKDSISQTGKYTAVVHYTIDEGASKEPESRVSEGAEL